MKRLLLFVSALLPLCSEGAILFRSIAPGEVVDNTGTALINNIDLNGDGNLDFFTTTAGNELSIVPTGNNRVLSIVATLPDLGRSITALLGGETIDAFPLSPLSWNGLSDRVNEFDDGGASIFKCNGRVQPGDPPICNSTLPFRESRFIGLELEKDGNTHYGWVEISSNLSVIHDSQIHGWAYESEAGQAILAGAIPEPTTALLVSLSLPILLHRRR